MSTPNNPSQLFQERVKKRILVPSLFAAFLALLLLAAIVRGTWAGKVEKNPKTPADGIVTQLFEEAGQKQIRCAMLVDFPMDKVWKAVTDYDHFTSIFPILKSAKATHEMDDKFHFTGTAGTIFGDFPFEARVNHEQSKEQCTAWWDNPSGNLKRNRGRWVLTSMAANTTLVAYSLELEVAPYPTFFVRNVLLSRQKTVLRSLNTWLKNNASK